MIYIPTDIIRANNVLFWIFEIDKLNKNSKFQLVMPESCLKHTSLFIHWKSLADETWDNFGLPKHRLAPVFRSFPGSAELLLVSDSTTVPVRDIFPMHFPLGIILSVAWCIVVSSCEVKKIDNCFANNAWSDADRGRWRLDGRCRSANNPSCSPADGFQLTTRGVIWSP
jgi:hypothetical protein